MTVAPAPGGRCINLTFHGVGERTRPVDPGEEAVWIDLRQFEDVLDAITGRPDVTLSFDDGNLSDVRHALPALLRRGLRATFFVVAGRLGEPEFLGEDDVRALAEAGMGIGCHGMHHVPWRTFGDTALHQELFVSRERIARVLGRPVTQAACPFGSYDRRVLRALRRYGYGRVFTSDRGSARPDRWLQARNTIGPGDGGDVVERILALDQPLPRAVRRRAKGVVKRWR